MNDYGIHLIMSFQTLGWYKILQNNLITDLSNSVAKGNGRIYSPSLILSVVTLIGRMKITSQSVSHSIN